MEPELATRSSRLSASLIDFFFAVGPFTLPSPGRLWAYILFIGVVLALVLAVQVTLLLQRGQTVGKWVMGIRIVGVDGKPVSAFRLLVLRYGLSWVIAEIPYAGALWGTIGPLLGLRKSRRTLEDEVAGTIVVKA